jgi:hypothetical protein
MQNPECGDERDNEAEIHPPVFRKLSKVSVTETDIRKGEWGNYVDKK